MSALIGLVGCASTKLRRPAPARDLYTSALFKKASAHAEATCERWFILSAKHGLVRPDDVLEPYDVKLGRSTPRHPETDGPLIHEWARRVRDQLALELRDLDSPSLLVLAGEQYRTILYPHSPWPFTVPMKGLGLGEQLSWLNKQALAPQR